MKESCSPQLSFDLKTAHRETVSTEPHPLKRLAESLETEIEDLTERIERARDQGLGVFKLVVTLREKQNELQTLKTIGSLESLR